ncbi:3-hydroxyacyl-CoA dehydrogenase NAD-binding domain-containing protein [Mesobacillus sp. AQ2]|uniref:3-hydroxyacyl-CoA dehydrogenase/enoyl-CoA hydratase family protein n=1 Tax=Mesobacillus sp. AQ2 TaxID=3043332 RepID=UPI0024C1A1C5|nr:3-hydroxyacyl-CoA dehydrogenase/enoyl-CoA hydratase family protein [Mesobacillus sp. AQ2]WHX43036.1 3-hydroxyacyl-CoA dehydrogenase NAD-binding domain-containing protein [Mesobacillus sp. AQ2]
MRQIQKAAVLGSGVMGSGIAAHLANIGIPTLLLDIVPRELTEQEKAKGLTLEDKQVRNRISAGSLQKLLKQKPAPLASKKNLALIEAGNFEDDMEKLKDVDWVIEVVVENLDIKKKVFTDVDKYRKQGSIISSNTSGISVEAMAEGRSEDFRKHFLGTHFFNPPRYLKLLEVIPTKDTDPKVLSFMKTFGEDQLGKGVVEAKDTPNFIANRIGTYGLLVTVREMVKGGYSVGEVDSVTGPMIGRPKSATFRTLDVVGLDTFAHVAKNVYDQVEGEEKEVFEVPGFMQKMLENGWFGSKSGQGFFLKQGKEILELDPQTMEYGPRKKLKTASTEMAKQEKGLANKMKALVYAKDRAGELLWNIFSPVLVYSADLLGTIADDIVAIDRAMKWGFGWEMGPFEAWDALGVEKAISKMESEGKTVPAWVKEMVEKGFTSFYKEEDGRLSYYNNGEYVTVEENPKSINLKLLKKQNGVIKKNGGASLIDLGDGIALLEFHSHSNSIGPDILQMINFAIDEVEKNYKGLVIGNQGKNFSVGANLAMILMEAQDDNIWDLDMVVRQFQQTTMKIKYSSKPIVAAPFGMTLGGGAEMCLPAAHIQASMETYMGLVEAGVGLIPGGGGNKELYIKHLEGLPKGVDFDLQKVANKVFETIAMAKVSTSGEEARENNFLNEADGISVNSDHLLYDAKQAALNLYETGYKAPVRKKVPVTGEPGYATLLLGAQTMHLSGYISEHDLKIAKKLAYVISGGKVPYGTEVDEQYLLDLEREAFLSLVAEPKSQQRMQHMLVKGKPLRN